MGNQTGHSITRPETELHGCSSYPQAVSTDIAQALVNAVHWGDQVTVQRILHRPDLPAIAVQLAERAPGRRRKPCGTRSAAERHIERGEPLDDACAAARRKYYRDRARRIRAGLQQRPRVVPTDVDPVVVGTRS